MTIKNCDRTCVAKLIGRARRKFKEVDFWIPGGAVTMTNFKTGKSYTGWPGLKFRRPSTKKDGTPSKSKTIPSHFSLAYCPVCGGKL